MTDPLQSLLPWDEASRLEALRALKLLDTPPERRFDRITHMVRDLFQVPIALISLVDAHRQWFKSCQGLGVSETPREISFCAHAILQDDIFVVENALEDPKFADNPLVTGEPFIRFYAGKPLHDLSGKKIGTLCVIGQTPRTLSPNDRERLLGLAAWAEREVNMVVKGADSMQRLENTLRLAHVLENAAEGVLSTSIDGSIETVNPACCDLFGLTAPALIGKNIGELIAPTRGSMQTDILSQLRSGALHGARNGVEMTGLRSNGEEFALEVAFTSIDIGERTKFTGIVRDISQRKQEELRKSEFISSVSHELRTPLTSILGALGMVREDAGVPLRPEDTRQLIDVAYLNSKRLSALVNDILDAEKLDAGMMGFHLETLPVNALMQEACMLNRPFATRLNVELQFSPAPAEMAVSVDSTRFIQILTNLISNACKFSPAGKLVSLSCAQRGDWIRISVCDQGPGIPDAFRSSIFQRFAQAQPSRNNKQIGTGLGLNLCKTMIEKMGGRIGFDSVAGRGATFFVELLRVI